MWSQNISLVVVIVLVSISVNYCQDINYGDVKQENDDENISPAVQNSELDKSEELNDLKEGSSEVLELDETEHQPDSDPIIEHVPDLPAPTVQPPPKAPLEKSGRMVSNHGYDYTNYDSLKERFIPPLQSQRGGEVYIITEERLKEIRSHFMYWYFDQGGVDDVGDYQKAIQTSSPQLHKNLNFQLPFFGFRFNYTRVSMHGFMEFSDPPENYPSYPLVFPNKDWPKKNDPSFIGIWLSKCRVGMVGHDDMDQRRAGVYFRMERDLMTRVDQFGVEVRERLKWDIREGVIGSETFDPKHAIFVTWKNMSFNGGYGPALSRTNTFQLVLVTDEVFTYAIFNYLDLQWTSHTEAGGDSLNGEGGVPAYVGFNAGNGTQSYEYLPYSQQSVIRDLSGRGYANGFKGRHIFRIDEKIILGTCNKDVDGANLDLVFAPESGNMLGGTVVNITGPCFLPTDKVICRFDTEEVYGVVVDGNRALCVQPQIFAEGYIRFEVAIGNGNYKWKGKFFIETPSTAAEKIFFADNSINEKSPGEIKITWERYNLTTNLNAPLRISLWGYRETTIRPEFLYIGQLAEGISNTGAHTIVPGDYRNRDDYLLNDIKFGVIQINLTQTIEVNGFAVTPMIWSKPIPLGWYFGPQWERLYGAKWPEELCSQWTKYDRFLRNFANELPQCPCTLRHALIDKGRYLPDHDCDKDANPKCMHHKGALHCVRTGAASLEGAEQQCCYDKNGYLMLTYDQQWGSRPHRSHNLGYLPWNEANKVPSLSYWFHDMIPLYLCCIWQDEQSVGCETFRFERRPTQDCVAYQAPQIATVFGDPHVLTFDDLEYTFNGKGEFALVSVNDKSLRLDVQGRFEQLQNNAYGEVRATQLTSVVSRGNTSTVVEVRLRPKEAQWRYRLDVFADGRKLYFDRPSLKFQSFPGLMVYTPTYILNQSEVIIMYDSGAGVEVVENEGFMTARVFLPWTFINKTRGLFGNWSFDITDDYTLPDGSMSAVGSNVNNFENVHSSFGIHWMLEDKGDKNKPPSLFYREFGRTSSYYNNRSFIPEFRVKPEDIIPQNRSIDINRAYELCSEYYQCKYDYAMSLNRDLVHFSKNYLTTVKNMKTVNNDRVVSCGVLETPRFGRKSNFLFVPGTKVTFECNQDFILVGDQRRTCLQEGVWDVPEYGYTECLREQEYASRTAGIAAAIILAAIIPIVFCIACCGWYLYKHRNDEESSWKFIETGSRSGSRLRLNEINSRTVSPVHGHTLSPQNSLSPVGYDRGFVLQSPVSSLSSTSSVKKRRSYDGVYRTHEPLTGVPEIKFEDKEWDVPYSDIGSDSPVSRLAPSSSPVYAQPFGNKKYEYSEPFVTNKPRGRERRKTLYDSNDDVFEQPPDLIKHSASNPNLLNERRYFTPDDYGSMARQRGRDTIKSQSSIITDV